MRISGPGFPCNAVGILVTAALLFAACFGFAPGARRSVQCPTATVRTVRVAVRDCCDRIVDYETRAPRAGDRAFVRCDCGEKKAAHEAVVSTKVVLFLGASAADVPPGRSVARTLRPVPYDARFDSVVLPPRVRPPTPV